MIACGTAGTALCSSRVLQMGSCNLVHCVFQCPFGVELSQVNLYSTAVVSGGERA